MKFLEKFIFKNNVGKDKIYDDESNESNPVASYDVRDLTDNFDWVNLMAYDMHGHWEDRTMHQAAAHPHEVTFCFIKNLFFFY